MIQIENINKICSEKGMTKMSISTYPTWVDSKRQEGIEFREGKIVPFWIKDAQRIYGEPAGDHIAHLIKALESFKQQKKEEEKPKKEEELKEEKKEQIHNEVVKNDEIGLLPDFLTPALMSKWAKMSTTDRVLMFQKTPKDKIKSVAVGKNDKGEMDYAPYVEGNFMFREANAAFLFDWYLGEIHISTCPTGVSVTGRLYCWFSEYNKYLTRPATGYQEMNKNVDVELAKKGATTDAIKKALSLFGFNSDVYGGEV